VVFTASPGNPDDVPVAEGAKMFDDIAADDSIRPDDDGDFSF
jgi:hypothetical protein